MLNTLILYCRGCNFFSDDPVNNMSDLGNYRLVTGDYNIRGKNGRLYFLEFTHWTRYEYRTTHKITGAPLKHPIRELKNYNGLCVDNSYELGNLCYRDLELMEAIHNLNLNYTKADILKAVNSFSADHYDDIKIINN